MLSDLQRLISGFAQMDQNGFDLNNLLTWGFFFVDSSKQKLLLLKSHLENEGFLFESLREFEKGMWILRVSKVEILSPEQLHKRNILFNALSEKFGVSNYDGWDVEKLQESDLL